MNAIKPVVPQLRAFVIWLLPALVTAVAVARVSVWIQPKFSPLVLFPMLIGAALGAILCGLVQVANLRSACLAIAGTLLVVLVTAAAEHAFFYLDRHNEHLRKALEAGIPAEVLSRPTFPAYMRQQADLDNMKIPLWIGNALLMVASAGGVVIWYMKSQHVDESMRDSHSPFGVPRDTNDQQTEA